MLLPLTSDADLKYWPIMTGVMILLNIVAYPIQWSAKDTVVQVIVTPDGEVRQLRDGEEPVGEPFADELAEENGAAEIFLMRDHGWAPWALSHGDGLHPLQWLTSMYMHGNVMHLIGNMVFLWVFGLVVEGRIGAFWFAVLYLGCGLLQNALGQMMFLFSPAPPSLGASGVIYSLMMIAAVWCPGDHIQSVILVFYQVFRVDIPILVLAAFYFLADLGSSLFDSFELSTPLLHVTGGFVGLVVGIVVLSARWVDCEQRDMWSRIREASGKAPLPKLPKKKSAAELQEQQVRMDEHAARLRVLDQAIDNHLAGQRPQEALLVMKQRRKLEPESLWDESRLVALLGALQQHKLWDLFLHHATDYLARFESKATAVRLNVARIQLLEKHRPRKCLELLQQIDLTKLASRQREACEKLVTQARSQIAAGELDFAD